MKKIISIILLIVVTAGISGGGVYLWQKQKSEAMNVNNDVINQETNQPFDWQTYNFNGLVKLSMRYPSDWKLDNSNDNSFFIVSKDSKQKLLKNNEACKKVSDGTWKTGDPECAPEFLLTVFGVNIEKTNLSLDKYVQERLNNQIIISKEKTKIGGLDAWRTDVVSIANEGLAYYVKKGDYILMITGPDNYTILELILNSIKFVN